MLLLDKSFIDGTYIDLDLDWRLTNRSLMYIKRGQGTNWASPHPPLPDPASAQSSIATPAIPYDAIQPLCPLRSRALGRSRLPGRGCQVDRPHQQQR